MSEDMCLVVETTLHLKPTLARTVRLLHPRQVHCQAFFCLAGEELNIGDFLLKAHSIAQEKPVLEVNCNDHFVSINELIRAGLLQVLPFNDVCVVVTCSKFLIYRNGIAVGVNRSAV